MSGYMRERGRVTRGDLVMTVNAGMGLGRGGWSIGGTFRSRLDEGGFGVLSSMFTTGVHTLIHIGS